MILHVTAGSSWWLFAAANLILFLHITGAPWDHLRRGRVAIPQRWPLGLVLSGTAEDHASLLHAGIAVALRASDCAIGVDGLLSDSRATHAMVQESEIRNCEDRPAVFPVKSMSMSLTAAF